MGMIRKHFHDVIFDGKSLADFGVHVSGANTFSAAERDYETVEVPGYNGSLHIDKNRFKSKTLSYSAFIFDNFAENASNFRNFMLSRSGARRLEDSYNPDEYRLAVYKGPFDTEAILLRAGEFEIQFECTGERFLKSGDEPKFFTANGKIHNPTYFPSKPLIRIYGSGTLGIGSNTIIVSSHLHPYIDIDCKIMDAYYEATNCNNLVSLNIPSGKNYVELEPEDTGIVLGNGITKVIIWPKWWIV